VIAGYASGHGIMKDGTHWTWGYNSQGSLGLGTTVATGTVTQVGNLSNWKKISGPYKNAAALLK